MTEYIVPNDGQPFQGLIGIQVGAIGHDGSIFVEFGKGAGSMWYRPGTYTWMRRDALVQLEQARLSVDRPDGNR